MPTRGPHPKIKPYSNFYFISCFPSDFVLPYLVNKDDDEYEKNAAIRARFLDTLQKDYGLEIEVSWMHQYLSAELG